MLISILSLVNHVCIMSNHFSDFSHIIANYNSNLSITVAEHMTGTVLSSFCFHFRQSFIQNFGTAQIVVHARG